MQLTVVLAVLRFQHLNWAFVGKVNMGFGFFSQNYLITASCLYFWTSALLFANLDLQ